MMPTGVFRCEILDANNAEQSIYVGVYLPEQGIPTINRSLEYVYSNDLGQQMLTCTSVGGPATSVSWWKDGQRLQFAHNQYQVITDSVNSVYDNVLLLGQASPDYVVGNYTCTVSNERGGVSNTIELHGESNNLCCVSWTDCFLLHHMQAYEHLLLLMKRMGVCSSTVPLI